MKYLMFMLYFEGIFYLYRVYAGRGMGDKKPAHQNPSPG